MTSGDANDLGSTERVESVHECDADVDFDGLAVGIAGSDAFAEGLEAGHLRCGFGLGILSIVSRRLGHNTGWLAAFCFWQLRLGSRLPQPTILAARNDWDRIAY